MPFDFCGLTKLYLRLGLMCGRNCLALRSSMQITQVGPWVNVGSACTTRACDSFVLLSAQPSILKVTFPPLGDTVCDWRGYSHRNCLSASSRVRSTALFRRNMVPVAY